MDSADANANRFALLQKAWRMWLRIHHRSLVQQHGDLVQEATADLLEWVAKHPGVEDEELRRVGFRVLQRRVADAFRSQVKNWAQSEQFENLSAEDAQSLPTSPDPMEVLQQDRLLRALLGILAELSVADRLLVVGEELGADRSEPLDDANRQRLSRLRRRIRERLKDFGAS